MQDPIIDRMMHESVCDNFSNFITRNEKKI